MGGRQEEGLGGGEKDPTVSEDAESRAGEVIGKCRDGRRGRCEYDMLVTKLVWDGRIRT